MDMSSLSRAQQTAYAAMLEAADGILRSTASTGIRRTTVEAMQRKGLVQVTCTLHTPAHGPRRTTRVRWEARLVPQMPTPEDLDELALCAHEQDSTGLDATLRPSQHQQAAAYLALTAPQTALTGSPAAQPDYCPLTSYTRHLAMTDAELLRLLHRHVQLTTGQGTATANPLGPASDQWLVTTEELIGGRTPTELARVRAPTENAAKMNANALLNRRGGYGLRRLRTGETDPAWVHDRRVGMVVLRVERTPEGTYRARYAPHGAILTVRPAAATAEAAAVAEIQAYTHSPALLPPSPAEEPPVS